MRIDEIEVRKAEIRSILDSSEEFDVDALAEEVRQLDAEKAEIEERAAKEAELRKAVAPSVIEEIEKNEVKEERKMENIEVRNSKEYIDAFAKYIKTGDDKECRALLSENATNGTVPVPEFVYEIVKNAWENDKIMQRVKKTYMRGNLKIGFEVSADGAVVHTEGGAAIDPENLVIGTVNLVPQSIKKVVQISREAYKLSGEPFLRYIYSELANKIVHKAADVLIAAIIAAPAVSTSTAAGVPVVTSTTVSLGLVASALANLSDEASDPVVIMNRKTWGAFKAAQAQGNYGYDPFEGLSVLYNNSMKAFSAASTGDTYVIVGDLGEGALANYPNGEDIDYIFDELTLKKQDMIEVFGEQFAGIGVVAPDAFAKIVK